ncbi:unnamed protein product [Pseudo-nitzschia multistriata]|uniref:Uncharacterized protein n=1 Tax=Pseudo-nitzschia multistriata TaxID=183589 RepID=A0A448Z6R0_9STRA|nr:unnamed protein product [Pseudo-nitzschia multistriata]
MSQRRGGSTKETVAVQNEEIVPFSQALDGPASGGNEVMDRESIEPSQNAHPSNLTSSNKAVASSVSLDVMYSAESQQIRTKAWQESYFARGNVHSTWEAEYIELKENGWYGECSKMMDGHNSNSVPCGCCSAIVCPMLGASRVGNMAVLKQSNEWVTEEVPDLENGGTKIERSTRPRLDFVVGPYWPMLCMITYPLILGVSGVTLVTVIPKVNVLVGIAWAICTGGLIFALAMTSFRDPGILPRHRNPPANQEEMGWRWNDRALSYRPRGSWYDQGNYSL